MATLGTTSFSSLSLSSLLGTRRELRPWESGCLRDRRKWLLQRGGHYEKIGCNNYTTGFFCKGGGTFLIISNTVKIYQLNRNQTETETNNMWYRSGLATFYNTKRILVYIVHQFLVNWRLSRGHFGSCFDKLVL